LTERSRSAPVTAVDTLTVLRTPLPGVEALTVFLDAACLLAVTSFDRGTLLAEVEGRPHQHLVDGLGSDVRKLLRILTALAVAASTI